MKRQSRTVAGELGERPRPAPADRAAAHDDDRALIQRMLVLTPEQRLAGLQRAAAFFAAARRG